MIRKILTVLIALVIPVFVSYSVIPTLYCSLANNRWTATTFNSDPRGISHTITFTVIIITMVISSCQLRRRASLNHSDYYFSRIGVGVYSKEKRIILFKMIAVVLLGVVGSSVANSLVAIFYNHSGSEFWDRYSVVTNILLTAFSILEGAILNRLLEQEQKEKEIIEEEGRGSTA